MDWSTCRAQHMLGEGEIYLNTGSFGSLHRRTFDDYTETLRAFEENPTMNHRCSVSAPTTRARASQLFSALRLRMSLLRRCHRLHEHGHPRHRLAAG